MSEVPSKSLAVRVVFRIGRFIGKGVRRWRERHQHPFNLGIHLIGIPLAFAGIVLLFQMEWAWGISALTAGYALQFLGHRVEGNDVGEWALVKRMLGLPYVAVAPRWQARSATRE